MAKKNLVIGDFLKQVKREVILKDNETYSLLGVKWYGKGMFLREVKKGKEIKAKKLYMVKKGDFVYNRLFAWKSSFAIVEEEFDGCLVSMVVWFLMNSLPLLLTMRLSTAIFS